jgi:hypothetical protein
MQKTKFDLEKALAGAKLVTGDGDEAIFVRYDQFSRYPLIVKINGRLECFTDNGCYTLYNPTPNKTLFLAEPPTPPEPMLSAEEWYRANIATARISTTIALMQQYGSYVADYINKNK